MRINRPLPTRDLDIVFSDVEEGNASTTKHGFLPKLTGLLTQFLRGDGAWAQITETALALSDVTVADVTTLRHGFAPKLPGTTTQFLRGDGTWATPPGVPWSQHYFGLISQSGTANPTETIIANTIGALTWTRVGAGVYRATRTDAFPTNKTFILTTPAHLANISITITHVNSSIIEVRSFNDLGTLDDDLLINAPLMILVFP